jgi:hypothetical protein
MTQAQVRKALESNPNAAIYVWHGEVYLDDGRAARMISPSIFCALYRDGAGEIAPIDATNSVYMAAGR